MDEKYITLEDIQKLCGYGTRVRVLCAKNGKLILDGLNALSRSKDRRQAAKWEAYKDVRVVSLHPGFIFSKGTVFSDSAYLTVDATIYEDDDLRARALVKNILGGWKHETE